MGAHRNYNWIIETLVLFKGYLTGDSPLVSKLISIEYSSTDEMENLPTNQDLSDELGIPRVKLNKELRELYDQFMNRTWEKPPEITNVFHTIMISIPWDERKKPDKKRMMFEPDEWATYFRLKLTHAPRIGEHIDLAFIEGNENYKRGYVYDVRHSIYGDYHEINVYVHPFNNYYHQWDKMKKDFEWKQRRGW
ncbi:hypothetical protein [Ekhidna sp.]|uniref:hypothetical protein n=1 Tax=Ekhidna sp. TaxID=2608089 RepID=UPI003518CF1D